MVAIVRITWDVLRLALWIAREVLWQGTGWTLETATEKLERAAARWILLGAVHRAVRLLRDVWRRLEDRSWTPHMLPARKADDDCSCDEE